MKRLISCATALALVLTAACSADRGASGASSSTTSGFSRGLVSITFDDGWASQYQNALPILDRYSLPATLYIISGSVGDAPDYMTRRQVQAFADRGDEIASHSVTHPDLTKLNAAQLDTELRRSQSQLRRMFGPAAAVDFASPYGAFNDTTIAAIRTIYASQRSYTAVASAEDSPAADTGAAVTGTGTGTADTGFNTPDNFDPYDIAVQYIVASTPAEAVQRWIDTAKAKRLWLVLVYHEVGASVGADSYHTDPAALDAELRAVRDSGLGAVTIRQGVAEIQGRVHARG